MNKAYQSHTHWLYSRTINAKLGVAEAESSPVPQSCFFKAQVQLWPDALPDVTNDFYQIQTRAQGLNH